MAATDPVLVALAWFVVAVVFVAVVTALVAVLSHRSIHARVARKPGDTEATFDVERDDD